MKKIDRNKQFGVTMDDKEMQLLEDMARNQGMTKSAFFRFILNQLAVNGVATVDGNWRAR